MNVFSSQIASAFALPILILSSVANLLAQEHIKTPLRETVLFPFDDHALPFSKGLVLTLVPGHKSATAPSLGVDPHHPGTPVMPIGQEGDPDYPRAYFCGTILHVEGEYRMWYSGFDGHKRQACYATSKDGMKWTKPKLGLVEYKGSRENNLVCVDGSEAMRAMIVLVLHEPEDPDPERRFKMIREVNPELKLAAVSADGLRWKSVSGGKDIFQGGNMEPSGFTKFNGAYYLSGHGGPVPHPIPARGYMRPQKRMMVTQVSHDFENWTTAGNVSFRRDSLPPRGLVDFEFHRGEQAHLGASIWNRGNVLLGFYGQYHNETNDRRTAVVDIGFIVSHDAIHYREPLPDFKMNVTGLSDAGKLTVEVLDERFVPLPGYAAADFTPIEAKSGLRLPVAWRAGASLGKITQPIRIRVNWSGDRQEKVRLFAIYLDTPSPVTR